MWKLLFVATFVLSPVILVLALLILALAIMVFIAAALADAFTGRW